MNTLTTISPLLDQLFAEADATLPALQTVAANLFDGEHAHLVRSKTDYLDLYTRLKDFPLPISPETGILLYMLARSINARAIVEFGTSIGVSTLHLAAALRDNGGGHLITSEFETTKAARAHKNLVAAGLGLTDLVEIRVGDALHTLSTNLPDSIDLLLLDGAKALYPDILNLVEKNLKHGAFVIADNADHNPEYLAWIREPKNGYLSIPFGKDVEVSMWIG